MLVFKMFDPRMGLAFDDDNDKGGGDTPKKDPPKDPDVKSMSKEDLEKLTLEMVDQKRSANAEAKGYREERDALKDKMADADKKKADADKTLEQKVADRDKEIEVLKASRLDDDERLKVSGDLIGKGYSPDLVTLGLKELTVGNSSETVKDFEKKFKSYLPDGDDDPTRKLDPRQPKPKDPTKKKEPASLAGQAMKEIRQSKMNN